MIERINWSFQLPHSRNIEKATSRPSETNVPLEYSIEEGLSYVASGVGKPLYFDEATIQRERINFAGACVEISVEDDIPDYFDLVMNSNEWTIVFKRNKSTKDKETTSSSPLALNKIEVPDSHRGSKVVHNMTQFAYPHHCQYGFGKA
ncbi:hypothetical protein L1049_027451 [Liquidambar formosana]|uniref:Uncharacterized protein n=1 Tax=Liquidambar formosana TaxID=63359 RepID=A0AAP0RHF6_LIQFO